MDFKKLQEDIHDNAVKHGWWEDKRPIMEIFALIHSELSEALEAYRDGDHSHIGEELADVAIRIFDLLGGLEQGQIVAPPSDGSFPSHIGGLHFSLSGLMPLYTTDIEFKTELIKFVFRLFKLAQEEGFDLAEEIKTKHARNKKRPYRHGGKAC